MKLQKLLTDFSKDTPATGRNSEQLFQIYGNDKELFASVQMRIKALLDTFAERFAADDVYIVRAPGRVNLIGEHTDYNGYPVMPMALNRDILVLAMATKEPIVNISNVDPAYSDREFSLDSGIVPFDGGDWGNYVKAAVNGLLHILREKKKNINGFRAVFSGNIPGAAGLSSSSAMVVASALTFLHANRVHLPKIQLAEILARAEHFVGTQGGGMDQAISLLGQANAALKIDFFPLRVQSKPLSPDYRIVICNSFIRAPKTESAMNEYNRRPIECRIVTGLLAQALGTSYPDRVQRLADLEKIPGYSERQAELAEQVLSPPIMSLQQVCEKLDLSEKDFREKYLKLRSGGYFTPTADGFKLAQRFKHVIEEAQRVELAASALENGDMETFGQLMNASHQSCRDLYEISTPEMDTLTDIARKHGAVGARLTGAGFGGCTVNLVHKNDLDSFIDKVRKDYYEDYLANTHPEIKWQDQPQDTYLFPSQALPGADVIVS